MEERVKEEDQRRKPGKCTGWASAAGAYNQRRLAAHAQRLVEGRDELVGQEHDAGCRSTHRLSACSH